jgi:hypothetical protein
VYRISSLRVECRVDGVVMVMPVTTLSVSRLLDVCAQSSSTTSSPYVSSSLASSAALSSAIFCVRNSLTSFCMSLSDKESADRYATRSDVVGGENKAGSEEVKVCEEVGEVYVAVREDILCGLVVDGFVLCVVLVSPWYWEDVSKVGGVHPSGARWRTAPGSINQRRMASRLNVSSSYDPTSTFTCLYNIALYTTPRAGHGRTNIKTSFISFVLFR